MEAGVWTEVISFVKVICELKVLSLACIKIFALQEGVHGVPSSKLN